MGITIWDKLSERDALRVKRIVDMLGNKEEIKIDNAPGAYMALVVDNLYKIDDFKGWKNLRVISFAHFSTQNGDAMRDPEVNFLYNDEGVYPLVVPFYFRNDYTGTETEAIDINAGTINNKKQKEITSFFRNWLENIYQQQDIAGMLAAKAFKGPAKMPDKITVVSGASDLGVIGVHFNGNRFSIEVRDPRGTSIPIDSELTGVVENGIPLFDNTSFDHREYLEEIVDRKLTNEEILAFLNKHLDSSWKEEPLRIDSFTSDSIAKPMEATNTEENISGNTQSQSQPTEPVTSELQTIETEHKEAASAEAMAAQPDPIAWFTADTYYATHPENILGVPYEASGRFGKVTKYKGTLEDIDRIEAETNFLKPFNWDSNPLLSTQNLSVQEMIVNPSAQENAKKALERSQKALARKIANAKPILIESQQVEMQSIEDIYSKYNPEITDEELFAFIWYRDSIGRRLSNHWYQVAFDRGGNTDYIYSDEALKKWVADGVLYYYGGGDVKKGSTNLVPAYLYLGENVWHKQARLEVDKEHIIATYGQAVYDQQLMNLKAVFKVKYDNRLTLAGAGSSNGLVVLPISDFAKKFMIKSFDDESPFFFKIIKASSNKAYGRPDFFHQDFAKGSKYGRNAGELIEEMSLQDAFCTWLVIDKSIQFKKGSSYAEIIQYYIQRKQLRYLSSADDIMGRKIEEAQHERLKARAKEEGDRLFLEFLHSKLTTNDSIRLETQWNSTFNGYVPINFNKVPVVFSCAKEFRNEPLEIRPEKREAAAFIFSEGSGCLAYGTGIGKTFSSIFTIAQFMYAGYCKKPLIVVPNSVYKQFMGEVKGLLPQFNILALYNLGVEYLAQLKDADGNLKPIPDNTISIMTYEGFENIGFNEKTADSLIKELYAILNQGIDEIELKPTKSKKDEKKIASFEQKLQSLVGRGLRNTMINIEDLDFDYITYDEAHKMKKVFTSVKGEQKVEASTGKKGGNEASGYDIKSGAPSAIALKGFMISYYIQSQNDWGNICLLTATPFTNSALEIYSMLSFIAYRKLADTEMNSLTKFFDNFIDVSYELVINSHLQPQRKQVIKGFNNLIAMQQLIRRFVNYKSEEDVQANKPNKIVLPLLHKRVGDTIMTLSPEERVETNLPMTYQQEKFMSDIKTYVDGKTSLSQMAPVDDEVEIDAESDESTEATSTQGVVLDYSALDDKEKLGVRILRAMSFSRALALSPYLYELSGLKNPTYQEYISTSPKLDYVMQCVRSVRQWHEQSNTPVSGQIIYMDRGLSYYCLIKEYLVKELGYQSHEVELVCGGMPKEGYRSKSAIQNRFLGIQFNEETLDFEPIPDSERVKIIIGSSAIREGMNLQKHSTVLYNCAVDWNPTDAIQLEGRIHRQGNLFNTVRICVPLLIDSMDIFMFQKLEEKTARINTIWSTNGKENVLKIEDFNPRELKNILIKDPKVLAEITIDEEAEKMDDEVSNLKAQIDRLENIADSYKEITSNIDDAVEWLEPYRDLKKFDSNEPIWEKAKYLGQKINEFLKKPTDKKGARMFSEQVWKWDYKEKILPLEKKGEKISQERLGYDHQSKPYWFDDFNMAARSLVKDNDNFLIPNKIKINKLDKYKEKIEKDIKAMEEEIKLFKGAENIKIFTERIIAQRARDKYETRSVGQVANDFKKLNYLLGDKKAVPVPAAPVQPAQAHRYRNTIRELISILKDVN